MKRPFIGSATYLKYPGAGTKFVRELSRLLDAYSDSTALEDIALQSSTILPALLLQRPHPRLKSIDHTQCLGHRIAKWLGGNVDSLLHECLSIQSRLNHHKHHSQEDGHIARTFNKLVSLRNLKTATRLITSKMTIVACNSTTSNQMEDGHGLPPGQTPT